MKTIKQIIHTCKYEMLIKVIFKLNYLINKVELYFMNIEKVICSQINKEEAFKYFKLSAADQLNKEV